MLKKSRKKLIIGLVVVVILFIGGIVIHQLVSSLNYISNIELTTPDISQIQDGVYNGIFETSVLSAEVDVTIEENQIIEIVINHHNYARGGGAEIIIDEVIINQSVEVDTISGATYSSLVILKAISDALESGVY